VANSSVDYELVAILSCAQTAFAAIMGLFDIRPIYASDILKTITISTRTINKS